MMCKKKNAIYLLSGYRINFKADEKSMYFLFVYNAFVCIAVYSTLKNLKYLDPFNRRSLWELIRKYKQGRTIILTTHYMEEADALSDRIALMNHGQVKCCGSPLFLKDKFGSGYRLTLSKEANFNQYEMANIVRRITGREPIIDSNIAREMCIAIPTEISSVLPELLSFIEENKTYLGVSNYGISSSTVEEVFLKYFV